MRSLDLYPWDMTNQNAALIKIIQFVKANKNFVSDIAAKLEGMVLSALEGGFAASASLGVMLL